MRSVKGILFFLTLLCTSPALAQTTFTVTNTDDNGEGSLRQAITDANENEGPDVIAFAIPGDGPHTITPQTFLPPMTDPVTLDGLSQPGADCSAWPPQLMIEIDGSEAGDFANGLGLGGGSDGSLVRGLVVNRFSNDGVGVYILANSNENHIACNFIGTDVSGTQRLGNSRGVFIRDARGNRIGGIEEAQRNLIAGNDNNVFIWNSGFSDGATGNHIEGNYIGTDVQGTDVIGSDGSNVILAAASENIIGGAAEGAGNVIAGGGQHGVYIYSTDIGPATGNLIQGNRIGTDAGGTEDLGNAGDGVRIFRASGNIIGGTDASGQIELGNTLEGIAMTSPDNGIGGEGEGDGNVIAFNGGTGVSVLGEAAVNNSLLGNRIYANDGLGIDLGEDEVTENDDGDSDDGPNALQNYPVITEALIAGSVAIDGTLSSTASTSFRLDFFASGACDASGYGEGERFLDFEEVTTDADGEAVFSVTIEGEVEKGTFITATATDPEGNTSEFSACYEIVTGVAVEDEAEVPESFALVGNYPNPFNPQTTIGFALPQSAQVRLVVYDVLGREVARLVEGVRSAGRHEAVFDASRLPSGVYLYRLEADGFVQTRRMLLIK